MTPRRRATRSACAGGYDFPVCPSLSAIEEPVFWTSEADPGTVLLTAAPPTLDPRSETNLTLNEATARPGAEGLHLIDGVGLESIHIVLLDGATQDQPLAALVPFDAYTPDRLAAISRLWHAQQDPPPSADTRLTPQRRRRLRHMLQALDGRTCQATYRDIAKVMFGTARVTSDPWKTSALRNTTIRLVRDGLVMVRGGYRKLLHHRRRPKR